FPNCIEVYGQIHRANIVGQLRDGIGNNVSAIAALIPRLFGNQLLYSVKNDSLGDAMLEKGFVEVIRMLLPLISDFRCEGSKVLLRALANDVRVAPPDE